MQNKNYKQAISSDIFTVISKASQQLQVESYVIGGFVRDFFLKRGTAKDIDIVAIGSGIQLAEKVAASTPVRNTKNIAQAYATKYKIASGDEVQAVQTEGGQPQKPDGPVHDESPHKGGRRLPLIMYWTIAFLGLTTTILC